MAGIASFFGGLGNNAKKIQNINVDPTTPTNLEVLSYDQGANKLVYVPVANLLGTPLIYKGTWNATTNTPTLADGVGTSGSTYVVSVAGTQNLGSGSQTFAINDLVLYNGTIWERIPHTNLVTSVFGRQGGITAQSGDYTTLLVPRVVHTLTPASPGTYTLDLGQYDRFDVASDGPGIIFDITNCPSTFYEFDFRFTATGDFTFTSPTVLPAGGSVSGSGLGSITSNGALVLHFVTNDSGAHWTYSVMKFGPIPHASTHRAGGGDVLLSTDTSLGASDNVASTQKAVKTYVDAAIAAGAPPTGTAGGDLTGTYPNPTIDTAKVTTAKIADSNVTLAKIANIANNKLLGNVTGSAAAPAEITLDTDTALTANSDTRVATQKAVKAYVDSAAGSNKVAVVISTDTLDRTFTANYQPPGLTVTIAAAAGDILELTCRMNMSCASGNNIACWGKVGSSYTSFMGKHAVITSVDLATYIDQYVVQSGDISGGNVTFQIELDPDNANTVHTNGNNQTSKFTVKNLKH